MSAEPTLLWLAVVFAMLLVALLGIGIATWRRAANAVSPADLEDKHRLMMADVAERHRAMLADLGQGLAEQRDEQHREHDGEPEQGRLRAHETAFIRRDR